jgi:hypothetical protein
MDLNVIYSTYHHTFILVYLAAEADSTYCRYLRTGSYQQYIGGAGDYAESIVKNEWSDEETPLQGI